MCMSRYTYIIQLTFCQIKIQSFPFFTSFIRISAFNVTRRCFFSFNLLVLPFRSEAKINYSVKREIYPLPRVSVSKSHSNVGHSYCQVPFISNKPMNSSERSSRPRSRRNEINRIGPWSFALQRFRRNFRPADVKFQPRIL